MEAVEWDEFEMETADDSARARSTPENLNKSRESAKSGAQNRVGTQPAVRRVAHLRSDVDSDWQQA